MAGVSFINFKPIFDIFEEMIYVIRKSVSPFLFLSFIIEDRKGGKKIIILIITIIIPINAPSPLPVSFPNGSISTTGFGRSINTLTIESVINNWKRKMKKKSMPSCFSAKSAR